MTTKCFSTFNEWVEYEQGEPVVLDRTEIEESYQSSYVTMYNYIVNSGWTRRDRKWISPHYPEGNYTSITKAYEAQRVWDISHETNKSS